MKTRSTNAVFSRKNIIRTVTIVGLILLVPLLGNQFVDGWNWTFSDFIFAAVILFGTGLALNLTARKLTNPTYRVATLIAIMIAFLVIWVELAVGIFD